MVPLTNLLFFIYFFIVTSAFGENNKRYSWKISFSCQFQSIEESWQRLKSNSWIIMAAEGGDFNGSLEMAGHKSLCCFHPVNVTADKGW